MRSLMMAAGVGCVVGAGAAVAGPPVSKHIDPGAGWVVHLDLNAVDDTDIGRFLMEALANEADDFEDIREVMPNFWPGPEGGMFGVTLYGSSLDLEGDEVPEGFTAIIYGDDNIASWGSMLEAIAVHEGMEDEVKSRVIDGHEVWSFPVDDGARAYAGKIERRGNVAWVLAFDSHQIKQSIGMFSGGGGTDLLPRDGWRDGTILYASTDSLDGLDIDDQASRVIGDARSLRLRIGEDRGDVFLQAALDTGDDEHAGKIRNVVQGLLAIGQLMAGEDEELDAVMRVARGVEIDTAGSTVLIELSHGVQDVIGFLEEAVDMNGDVNIDFDHDDDDDEYDDDAW